MFGGWSPSLGYLNDTWEWNCAARSWTRISPAASPSGLNGSRMMYDPTASRMILFGGGDANRFYNDTCSPRVHMGRLATTPDPPRAARSTVVRSRARLSRRQGQAHHFWWRRLSEQRDDRHCERLQ